MAKNKGSWFLTPSFCYPARSNVLKIIVDYAEKEKFLVFKKKKAIIAKKGSAKMIGSNAYNYINVLGKAAEAGWVRNELINNNIANVNTPNYKRRDVQFESYLMTAVAGGDSLDDNIDNIDLSALNPVTYTEYSGLRYRLDGNNVDIDTESAELAKNQLRYYTLIDSMNQEFGRIKTVLTQS